MTINWGTLAKSIVSNETIEQTIARLIGVHTADPDSHVLAGQSLQSHKAAAIIDHLAGSIVTDKLAELAVTGPKITNDQIIAKDFRTATDVGAGVDGVKFNPSGIEMWQSGLRKVNIPISGDPTFLGNLLVRLLSYLRYTWHFGFESTDGYTLTLGTGASVLPKASCMQITCSSVASGKAGFAGGVGWASSFWFDGNPSIQFDSLVSMLQSCDAYVVFGDNDPFVSLYGHWFGFKFVRGSYGSQYVQACYMLGDNSEFKETLLVFSASVYRHFKAEVADGGTTIKWYIDGVLVLTKTISKPVSTYFPALFGMMSKRIAGTSTDYFQMQNLVIQHDFFPA